MMFSPNTRRNINRIIPFGIIWVLMGWVFILVEIAAMGTPDPNSLTIIGLNWQVSIFASIAVLIVGLFVGTLETLYVEKLFRNRNFLQKILLKLGLYAILMLLIISITYPIAASLEEGISILDSRVWNKFNRFFFSVTFASTLLQMGFSMLLCLIYSAISENLGHAVLVNFFLGKYHKPRVERRIFMFLDLKDSTTIAEKLGHIRYFDLLREYYSDLSRGIIDHEGEVYQYIGDEIVITWKYDKGIRNNNCIAIFFAMKKDVKRRSKFYQDSFQVFPEFKAGIHCGNVTTGEIGALKKEIFFTGDVLNTTSRIQNLCNTYKADFLASKDLVEELHPTNDFQYSSVGEVALKGKSHKSEILKVDIPS